MSRTSIATEPQAQIVDGSPRSDRPFYVIAAVTMLFVTAVGFRNFYLHGKGFGGDITGEILALVVAHGLAMTGCVVLFLIQSLLISAGNRRLHMTIGPAGAVLAGAIVILGTAVALLSVHFNPPEYKELGGGKYFLALMLTEVVSFAILAGAGILYRRRPEIHRPMMLLATLQIMTGSLGRWPYAENLLAISVPLYLYGPMLILGALFFLLQWGMNRAPNRWYAAGYAVIATACVVSVGLANSGLWNQLTASFVP
jgi:hypothetical protein